LEELGAEGKVMIYCILRESVGRANAGLSWLRICTYYSFSSINENVAAVGSYAMVGYNKI
jgi:hypothetical protein